MDTYEKKYNEALEMARNLYAGVHGHNKAMLEQIFPELRESEDERIRKWLLECVENLSDGNFIEVSKQDVIFYLEKQKDHFRDDTKMVEQKPRDYCSLRDEFDLEGNLVQKPTSTEDMPYITDEHFFEREPADSFKYKLAEYMTKCCTKKEGPYGYTYAISAEAILKMAEEELLKRGVVQKPAEWSEEDGAKLGALINYFEGDALDYSTDDIVDWLKSLRPQPHNEIYQAAKRDLAIKFMNYLDENRPEGKMSLSNGECEDIDKAFKEGDWAKIIRYIKKYQPHWKPSEEQMSILRAVKEHVGRGSGYWGEGLGSLIKDLERLM